VVPLARDRRCVRLERRIGKHREEFGPDRAQRLIDGFFAREIRCVEGGWLDTKTCEVEAGELLQKAVVHGVVS
jgi:hypothetical protein